MTARVYRDLREYVDSEREAAEEKHAEACSHVAAVMTGRGFMSVFEHATPAFICSTVYTLWVNISTGSEMLTIVNPNGAKAYYKLWPALAFDNSTSA